MTRSLVVLLCASVGACDGGDGLADGGSSDGGAQVGSVEDDCPLDPSSDLPGASLHFDVDRCVYTVEEVEVGLAQSYTLQLDQALSGVDTTNECQSAPDDGMVVNWFLASETSLGCERLDDGMCSPPPPQSLELEPGTRTGEFTWYGVAYTQGCDQARLPGGVPGLGPEESSTNGLTYGVPVAPGRYTLSVVVTGEHTPAPPAAPAPFHITAARVITIDP